MKMLAPVIAAVMLTFVGLNAHAIKFKKCAQKSFKDADMGKSSSSFSKTMNNAVLQTSVSSSTSSTSFTSSTGECGAFAIFKVREQFIAENFDQVREDSARGEGEYITALAALSGCDSAIAQSKFQNTVQEKFESLYFSNGTPVTSRDLGRQVDAIIKSDSTLNHMCQLEG